MLHRKRICRLLILWLARRVVASRRRMCLFAATTWILPAFVLALCLFAPAQSMRSYGAIGTWIREIEFTFRDAETQWMVFACLGVYFVTFALLQKRQVGRLSERAAVLNPNLPLNLNPDPGARGALRPTLVANPDLWLSAGLVIVALAYALNYPTASKSTEALVLLAGIVLGKGAAAWSRWNSQLSTLNLQSSSSKPGSSRGNEAHSPQSAFRTPHSALREGLLTSAPIKEVRMRAMIVSLTTLLLLACFWQAEELRMFQYRGQARWTGPWDNPNIFGMLMGVGLVLALGQFLSLNCWTKPSTFNLQPSTGKSAAWRWAQIPFYLAAVGAMTFALIKSYSRGAWLATAIGLAYLGYQRFNHEIHKTHENETPSPPIGWGERAGVRWVFARLCSCISCVSWFRNFVRRNWVALSMVLLSVVLLTFWNYRHTERTVARRAFSVGNVNDFSWRNRVAAWEGALQIMAEKPWLGGGWNRPQQLYDKYYLPSKMEESAAIQMNDHLMLGMTLGIPALACFAAYIYLALVRGLWSVVRGLPPATADHRPSAILDPPSSVAAPWLRATCHAAAIVLLVAFWFDGGLFKLATGATFWILLELGRKE